MKKMIVSSLVIAMPLMLAMATNASADSCAAVSGNQDLYSNGLAKKGEKRMERAAEILAGLTDSLRQDTKNLSENPNSKLKKIELGDAAIPVGLIAKAQCVVVIPNEMNIDPTFTGAWSIRYGNGVSICRDDQGQFSQASFVKIRGGDFGAQIGEEATDHVMLFMNKDAPKDLQKRRLKLGGDLSVAAGPLGRDAMADADVQNLNDDVLSYSHSKGLYAGVSLDGAVLEQDKKMNEAMGGQNVKRNVFEKMGHGFGSLFHHHKSSCEQTLDAAGAAADLNKALSPLSSSEDMAAADDSQKDVTPPVSPAAPAVVPAASTPAPAAAQAPAVANSGG